MSFAGYATAKKVIRIRVRAPFAWIIDFPLYVSVRRKLTPLSCFKSYNVFTILVLCLNIAYQNNQEYRYWWHTR